MMPSSASIGLGGALVGRTSTRTSGALMMMMACPTVVLLRLLTTAATAAAPSSAAASLPDGPGAQSWWTPGTAGLLGPIYHEYEQQPAHSSVSSSSSDGINTIGGGSASGGSDKDASIAPLSDDGEIAPGVNGGSGGLMGWFSSNSNNDNNNKDAPSSSSWSFLPFSSGDIKTEEPEDEVAVIRGGGGMCVDAKYVAQQQHVWSMWVEMDDDRGECYDVEEMLEEEEMMKSSEGGSDDVIIQDVAKAAAAAVDDDTPADIIESGGSIHIISVYADDAVQDDANSVATSTTSYPSIIDGTSSGSYDSAPVEFNQHLLVEVSVAIVDPWKQTVGDCDIASPSPPQSAHVMNDVGVGGSSGRGAAWSGDHGSSGSGSHGNGGSGWAVTLEEVVFTHRESGSRLEQMERRLWPTGGASGSAASASTSFLIPLDSLHRHITAGADDGDDPIDNLRELVLRASLVELIPSVNDDTIGRRVAMVRLVPVPLTEDGLINPLISVHLNGTASVHPFRIGDDPTTPSATSSWGSMLITALAAVAVGVVMALCFLHLNPAYVDEYEHYQQQFMEEEHIHYMHAHALVHLIDNEAGTEAMGEMASMEVDEGVEGNMLIGDDADAASSQADEAEEEDDDDDDDDMASPPDVRRKMTANDTVGTLSTPVKTPVKEQPVTSGLGAMPSASNPLKYNNVVNEAMPLPDDGSVQQQPQMDQPLLGNITNDDDNAVLPETNGIGEKSPGSGGQHSASIDEQKRSSFGSFGLTLGQRSFCSDSSAASASSIETHLHANWKQSQSQSQKETAPTADTAPRDNTSTSIVASSPTRSTSSSIAAEAGNMTTIGDATTERQGRQPRRRPRQLPSQNAALFVEKRSPKHRKVEVKPLPTIGASRRLKKEEKKWDDSRYKFGATASAGGSLSSKDRSASTNKAPSVAKSDSSKSSSKRKRKMAMPLASISVPSDVNAKKQRKSA